MTDVQVLNDTNCMLGEGPLWHPEREALFWFDIVGKRLYCHEDGASRHWQFDEYVSAAGWVDRDTLLMASATGLWRFDILSGERRLVMPLEAENPRTRSNDGRADPWGGFWIGTMGVNAEPGAGAIYRYYRGELRQLVPDVTISNAICFDPDRSCAYYTDTRDGRIMRQPLHAETGWPEGEAEVFVDVRGEDFGADGAVVDAEGCLWNAQWGASRVARYGVDGALMSVWPVPTPHASCPAFGGPDLTRLFVTTAAEGTEGDADAGKTYVMETGVIGQREHRVVI
ncbi:MAG: SMP-30/gluconolactonase/LRE family protein [Marivivens sp.]|nr:SMP-30/gluconolactonase/LRE family protein [Marivivens sp.]